MTEGLPEDLPYEEINVIGRRSELVDKPMDTNACDAITCHEPNTEIKMEEDNTEQSLQSKIEESEEMKQSEFEHTTNTTSIKSLMSLVSLLDVNEPRTENTSGLSPREAHPLAPHIVGLRPTLQCTRVCTADTS